MSRYQVIEYPVGGRIDPVAMAIGASLLRPDFPEAKLCFFAGRWEQLQPAESKVSAWAACRASAMLWLLS